MSCHKGYKKVKYSYRNMCIDIDEFTKRLKVERPTLKYIYGPPRGGSILAVCLSHSLKLKFLPTLDEPHVPEQTLIVDDVSDTGETLQRVIGNKHYVTLTIFIKIKTMYIPHYYKRIAHNNEWIVYWWEKE